MDDFFLSWLWSVRLKRLKISWWCTPRRRCKSKAWGWPPLIRASPLRRRAKWERGFTPRPKTLRKLGRTRMMLFLLPTGTRQWAKWANSSGLLWDSSNLENPDNSSRKRWEGFSQDYSEIEFNSARSLASLQLNLSQVTPNAAATLCGWGNIGSLKNLPRFPEFGQKEGNDNMVLQDLMFYLSVELGTQIFIQTGLTLQ